MIRKAEKIVEVLCDEFHDCWFRCCLRVESVVRSGECNKARFYYLIVLFPPRLRFFVVQKRAKKTGKIESQHKCNQLRRIIKKFRYETVLGLANFKMDKLRRIKNLLLIFNGKQKFSKNKTKINWGENDIYSPADCR